VGLGLAHLLACAFSAPRRGASDIASIVLGVAAVVATLGSVLPLRRVLQLDPASVLRVNEARD